MFRRANEFILSLLPPVQSDVRVRELCYTSAGTDAGDLPKTTATTETNKTTAAINK